MCEKCLDRLHDSNMRNVHIPSPAEICKHLPKKLTDQYYDLRVLWDRYAVALATACCEHKKEDQIDPIGPNSGAKWRKEDGG